MKITVKKIKEYRKINIDGFVIDLNNLCEDYPQLIKEIYKTDKVVLRIEITFNKEFEGNFYEISVKEFNKVKNRPTMVRQDYINFGQIIQQIESKRFSIKKLQEICKDFTSKKDYEKECINEYKKWILKKQKAN